MVPNLMFTMNYMPQRNIFVWHIYLEISIFMCSNQQIQELMHAAEFSQTLAILCFL